MTDLLPCPFCGSDAAHYPDGEDEGYRVMCSGNRDPGHQCYYGCFADDDADAAEKRWNRRAPLPASHEQVEALRKELRGKADAAYCRYIEELRKDQCLGWEHKVKTGRFGEAELKAHCTAAEYLGMHRAYSDALAALHPHPSAPKGESE